VRASDGSESDEGSVGEDECPVTPVDVPIVEAGVKYLGRRVQVFEFKVQGLRLRVMG
jgi:hypothetical protein